MTLCAVHIQNLLLCSCVSFCSHPLHRVFNYLYIYIYIYIYIWVKRLLWRCWEGMGFSEGTVLRLLNVFLARVASLICFALPLFFFGPFKINCDTFWALALHGEKRYCWNIFFFFLFVLINLHLYISSLLINVLSISSPWI